MRNLGIQSNDIQLSSESVLKMAQCESVRSEVFQRILTTVKITPSAFEKLKHFHTLMDSPPEKPVRQPQLLHAKPFKPTALVHLTITFTQIR